MAAKKAAAKKAPAKKAAAFLAGAKGSSDVVGGERRTDGVPNTAKTI